MMPHYIILLLLMVSCHVTTERAFRRYDPIIFQSVHRPEDVDNEALKPGFANIYVSHNNSHARFKISFFGNTFSVVLVKTSHDDILIPSSRIKLYGDEIKLYRVSELNLNHYVGRVLDSPGSFVQGQIDNHVFSGSIQMRSKTFYVQHYSRHFNESSLYNAFVYEPEDPYIRICEDDQCDLMFGTSKQDQVQLNSPNKNNLGKPHNATRVETEKLRIIRQAEDNILEGKACEVLVVSDHTFYEFHQKVMTNLIEEATDIISAVNMEFEQVDFNGDGKPDHFSIVYAATEIYQRPTGRFGSGLKDDLSQEELLLAFSQLVKKNPYCLAILFTARDFHPNAGIGLAFTAVSNPRGPDGGICSAPAKYGLPISGYARLNTLLVSFINDGQTVPLSTMVVSLLHQIGHSFGSYHDPMSERSCTPNDEKGDFIMYPELHQEKLPNSRKFSSCSISRMLPVIRNKGWCLIERKHFPLGQWRGKCGNGIVDDEETCDCGIASTCEALDPCCRPPGGMSQCSLLPGASCSPSVDACCSFHCGFKDPGVACGLPGDPECASYGICVGGGACVHMNAVKGNLQTCGEGRGKCIDGMCLSSLCADNGLELCQCELPASHRCHVCCKTLNGTCISTSVLGLMGDNNSSVLTPVGRPCYNNMGTCNRFGACEIIVKGNVTDRVLFGYRRLKVQTESSWFTNNVAYLLIAIVLIVVLILILLGLFVIWQKTRLLIKFRESCLESKRRIKDKGEDWDELFGRMRCDDWTKERIIRLYALFPFASPERIVLASLESTETEAVEYLIDQGFPIRKNFDVIWPQGTLVKTQ